MKRAWTILGCVVVLAAFAGAASAQVGVVSNVKVVSDKVEDVTTLDDWKATYLKPGMTDDDKMIAIWKTVIKYRHQTAPPNEYLSGLDGKNVHDVMKTIHVYGYGQCCCASSNIEGLARLLGYPARGRVITDHSVPEVFYRDAWHLLDASVMNYFIKDDGSIAGVDDVRDAVRNWYKDNPELSRQLRGKDSALRAFAKNEGWKKGPALLARCEFYGKDGANDAGWHGWMSTMQEYDRSLKDTYVDDYGPQMGYQVNVQLREGEKLTRNWFNKGLHVNMFDGKDADPKIWKGRDGLALQAKFGDVAPGRIGNGVLEWTVPLNRLAAVALSTENIVPGLAQALDRAKPGVIVLRVPSSYVYLTGKAELKAVVGAGGAVAVSFSDNNGLDFREVQKIDQSGDVTIDLSKLVLRRYDYRLKIELTGAATALDALKITHDVQHSQAPLPAIVAGTNTIHFTAGAQEGTITYEGCLEENAKGKQVLMSDFHPVLEGLDANDLRLAGGRGSATYTLATPGNMTRIRFNSYWRARDAKDGYTVDASFDDGKQWVKMADLPGPIKGDSKYTVFDKVPAGVRKALVRFSGRQSNTTCMFNLSLFADYKEPAGGFRPVQVTYVWTEGGNEKTSVHVAYAPKDVWVITCGPNTVPKSYTVEPAK